MKVEIQPVKQRVAEEDVGVGQTILHDDEVFLRVCDSKHGARWVSLHSAKVFDVIDGGHARVTLVDAVVQVEVPHGS